MDISILENTSDVISRQAAIDTEGLDEEIRCEMCKNPMQTDRGCDGNCKYDEKMYERITQILNERIKPLPPAQPDWIPCSEKLPKVGEKIIRTTKEYGWNGEEYYVVDIGIYDTNIGRIVAWMPLPEPYER